MQKFCKIYSQVLYEHHGYTVGKFVGETHDSVDESSVFRAVAYVVRCYGETRHEYHRACRA